MKVWQVTRAVYSIYTNSDLQKALADGWEPFAVVIESVVAEGYRYPEPTPVVYLRKAEEKSDG